MELELVPLPDGPTKRQTTLNLEDVAFPLHHVDCIILRPEDDSPVLSYHLSSGERYMNCFATDEECDAAWRAGVELLVNQGFIFYQDAMLFRGERLVKMEKVSRQGEQGLHFVFRSRFEFTQCYLPENVASGMLDNDYAQLVHILGTLQEKSSTTHMSTQKQ